MIVQTSLTSPRLTFLGSTKSSLPLTHLITRAHQNLTQTLLLPRRENQYARQIVVVPAHLLLAEEANDLTLSNRRVAIKSCVRYARRWIVRDKEVVEEGGDVVKNRLCVEEELGEETQVLREELVLLAVDFVEGVAV